MKRVVIVGGGMSGLVAAWVFQNVGAAVTVLEPRKAGGSFLDGGLKYIHRTDAMAEMLDTLGVISSAYIVQGGILLRGKVLPYPRALQEMTQDERDRIQLDHYRKTRRTTTDDVNMVRKSMNDPAATGSRRALKCDFEELIGALARRTNMINASIVEMDSRRHMLKTNTGERITFDYMVTTLPLWIMQRLADFYVPDALAMALNVIQVTPRVDGPYSGFDYVYTPYTPADTIHRLSPALDGYSCESNGILDHEQLQSDLQFIFPDGYVVEGVKEGLKGHLIPLAQPAEWPDHVAPLGRFAKWDSRATTDVTLDDALALTQRWGMR